MSKPFTPLAERFWAKVEITPSCWLWTGAINSHGYGNIGLGGVNGGTASAYCVAYQLLVGPIPEGMELDHLCRNTRCVNPDHLEPVTHRENLLRGRTVAGVNSRKTHCVHGHKYTLENTRLIPKGKRCRECDRLRCLARYKARKAI